MDTAIKEGWYKLTLPEQMVNIGNEVKRAIRFDGNSEKKNHFIEVALEYTDLTISDPKNHDIIPELNISKEVLKDYIGKRFYDLTKEQIRDYYMAFVNRIA